VGGENTVLEYQLPTGLDRHSTVLIILSVIRPNNTGQDICLQVSNDGGETYSESEYDWAVEQKEIGGSDRSTEEVDDTAITLIRSQSSFGSRSGHL